VVLSYYVLQGEHTTDATAFSGPRWRRPNLGRDAGFYVAQVQITQPIYVASLFDRGEANVKAFAAEAADGIDALFPAAAGPSKSAPARALGAESRD
jgi:hypothetical protein